MYEKVFGMMVRILFSLLRMIKIFIMEVDIEVNFEEG